MISILNRWRQSGRRYFWSHLLLGMVAAAFGLPGSHASSCPGTLADKTVSSLNSTWLPSLNTRAFWQENPRRAGFSPDYWQQHAIRTVIRHLAFRLTPIDNLRIESDTPVHRSGALALLVKLNALLMHEVRPSDIITQFNPLYFSPAYSPHQDASWLAVVVGIRAGPGSSA